MRYTLLGNSGLRVSEVALGTMTFGTDWDGTARRGSPVRQVRQPRDSSRRAPAR
jgi:aryl-alcohol dehydrogenase-like predicted oxidoreductase